MDPAEKHVKRMEEKDADEPLVPGVVTIVALGLIAALGVIGWVVYSLVFK